MDVFLMSFRRSEVRFLDHPKDAVKYQRGRKVLSFLYIFSTMFLITCNSLTFWRFDSATTSKEPLRRNPPERYQLQAAGEGFTESTVGKGLNL